MPRTIKLVRSLETHFGYLKGGTIIIPSNEAIARRLLDNNVAVEEVEPERQADGVPYVVTYEIVDTALEEEPTDDRDDDSDDDLS